MLCEWSTTHNNFESINLCAPQHSLCIIAKLATSHCLRYQQVFIMSIPLRDKADPKASRNLSADSAAQIEKVGSDGDVTSLNASAHKEDREYTHLERQRNPYLGKSEEVVVDEINTLVNQYSLDDLRDELVRGARLAYDRTDLNRIDPSPEEVHWIEKETSLNWKDKWIQTKMMYYVAFLCGSAAIVQGMDQTAVNGAQL